MQIRWLCLPLLLLSLEPVPVRCDESGVSFFEKQIRPVLEDQCLSCHNSSKQNGGLSLDDRAAWQKGGDSGKVIVPGHPQESLLLRLIRHEEAGREMPAKAPQLDDRVIADFAEWIRIGAPDPRDKPSEQSAGKNRPWGEIRDERAQWWSFQPLAATESGLSGSALIDELIDRRLRAHQIQPAPRAERRVLLRRLSYRLRGLPPAPSEIATFLADDSSTAWQHCVERMLQTHQFGERWARHWMDVVRYADTHGSEDDAYLPFAWRYRDYLIRAFHHDVPFDQLVREHIAGDLIPARRDAGTGVNESVIATAFWRFVEFNQTPVDVKREEITVIDNQIDAFGKAFQALTISCARCHDHKFDPISDEDYYALYGILRSTRAATRIIDAPELLTGADGQLEELARQIRAVLADAWLDEVAHWPDQIRQGAQWIAENLNHDSKPEDVEARLPEDAWTRFLWTAARQPDEHALYALAQLLQKKPDVFRQACEETSARLLTQARESAQTPPSAKVLFDLRNGVDNWQVAGAGLPADSCHQPGRFAVQGGTDNIFAGILERGYHSNVLSDRHCGVLCSPEFILQDEVVSVEARGSGNARLRLVIENFQGDSLLFATVNPTLNSGTLTWYRMLIRPQWRGLRAHLELLTRDDKPYVGILRHPGQLDQTDGRSGFGIGRVVQHADSVRLQSAPVVPPGVWESGCESVDSLMQSVCRETQETLRRWQADACHDQDARWLSALMEAGLLTSQAAHRSQRKDLLKTYMQTERQVPIAQRCSAVREDHFAVDQEFLPRGDHRHPQAPVPRRYLEILGGRAADYAGRDSGRLQLAESVASRANPLTARVYVNRVWHWIFGKGLVTTVDNFGRMGERPSHPELLDELTLEFIDSGWSTKQLIRNMLLSSVWQRDSVPTSSATERDPVNQFWSHAQMQRLDAESIRDTLVALSGTLRAGDKGQGTLVFYRSVLDERKQPPPGPLDGDNRRSVFLEVRRNFPNEFMVTFDFPKPSAPAGRRNETTVPAQSLTLLNDPFPLLAAQRWAVRICGQETHNEARMQRMYLELFGREPTPKETERGLQFVAEMSDESTSADGWTSLAHALFNFKEMIFLR